MNDPVRRVHYYVGQALSAEDLAAEQDYHRRMRYLHNRRHGTGVVEGLEVAVTDDQLVVSPGIAVDGLGREIVLTSEVRLDLTKRVRRSAQVCVVWAEEPDGYVASPDPDDLDSEQRFSRWVERPRVTVEPEGKEDDEALLLARLSRDSSGSVVADLSVRRTLPQPHA